MSTRVDVERYQGDFGPEQARRLLNRAGFGPRPGDIERTVALGLTGAVHSLTRPKHRARLAGPAPRTETGKPLAPMSKHGHDHLWWLDRMVRSDQPLTERMTLVLHDWFATPERSVSSPRQMIAQSNLFREHCRGSFLDLFRAITIDPAMLHSLSGAKNKKGRPNENYGREMMELHSLGPDCGAYTEFDVREQARSLTGWTGRKTASGMTSGFHYDPRRHDDGVKTVFGRSGRWNWRQAVLLCVQHRLHASFLAEKLWSYFVPTPPSAATLDALVSTYRSSRHQLRPLLETILMHRDLYEGEPMVKPPAVYVASLLRALGRPVDSTGWINLCAQAGQFLFRPPDVSGWDDRHWLDTARMRARWRISDRALSKTVAALETPYSATETAAEAVERARTTWGSPALAPEHQAELLDLAQRAQDLATTEAEQSEFRRSRQNALLQLIGVSPELILQ